MEGNEVLEKGSPGKEDESGEELECGEAANVGYVRTRAKPGGKHRPVHREFSFDYKVKAVKLYVEEGRSSSEIETAIGLSPKTLAGWVARYRRQGEEGLRSKRHPPRPGLPEAVKAQIVEVRKENPGFGVRRISQMLGRLFLMRASPETVRGTLHAHGLIEPVRVKPRRNPPKPRFFERSTPNQMWQSDIFTFRLGGKNAYLIGFIDDYSRFLVGLDVYRGQTAENVLELYRRAVGEFGVPREMLTDNGRQYATWRGTTRFQQEMQKDRIHHIRSQPHHPMTLGKIERFWKSIWEEFLCKAQFDSFENARERIRFWVQYYNHRRPHQGIGGLCPADRFFEIRSDLRQVLEKGIEANAKELALRGRPQPSFYMVGRMNTQSIVMQAEKGRMTMSVKEDGKAASQVVTVDLKKGTVEHDSGENGETDAAAVHRGGQMPGGADDLDGAAVGDGCGAGTGGDVDGAERVAGTGDDGDDLGARTEADPCADGLAAEHTPAAAAGSQGRSACGGEGSASGTGETAGGNRTAEAAGELKTVTGALSPEVEAALLALVNGPLGEYLLRLGDRAPQTRCRPPVTEDRAHGTELVERSRGAGESPAPGRTDHGGAHREDDSHPGGRGTGGLPQDLVRMGGAGARSHGDGSGGPSAGSSPGSASGPGEGATRRREPGPASASRTQRSHLEDPGADAGLQAAAGNRGDR
jgi:transposase InsO family protein